MSPADDQATPVTGAPAEGLYKRGDACRFLDPDDPAQGLVFVGRVTEDVVEL